MTLGLLVAVVVVIQWLSRRPAMEPLFRWLPVPLWCYSLPVLLKALGWLPATHPAYQFVTDGLFPVVVGLMLLPVDARQLRQVGGSALIAMAAGSAGIIFGAPLVLRLFAATLPPEAWKGVATLAATWTGGSMNMVAIRAVLEPPESVFAPLILVDALVAYSWMAILIASKGLAPAINRWLRAREIDAPAAAIADDSPPFRLGPAIAGTLVAIAATVLCRVVASQLPRTATSVTGWTVLLVSAVALAAAAWAPARRLGRHSAPLATGGLLLVLAALGVRADWHGLTQAPAWLLLGATWVACHAIVLLLVGRWRRLPLSLLATASQANIGGVVSAPAVAAVHSPALAPIGLLLALAGNALGTYLGLLAAWLCRIAGG